MPTQNEFGGDLASVLTAALDGRQASMWTAIPAKIVSFDPIKCTAKLQPTIQARVRNPDGSFSWLTLSALVNVPVVFPSGGGFTLTFPLTVGDEALVVFSSRSIDYWWLSGNDNNQQCELRMHSPSDGFAIVGPKSVPKALLNVGGVSTVNAELRSDDGLTSVALTPIGAVIVNAPAGITLQVSPSISLIITALGAVNIVAPLGLFVNGVEVIVP